MVASLLAKLCKDQFKKATAGLQKRDHSGSFFSIFKIFFDKPIMLKKNSRRFRSTEIYLSVFYFLVCFDAFQFVVGLHHDADGKHFENNGKPRR